MEEVNASLVHDTECERKVIGTIFMFADEFGQVAEHLNDECFYDKQNLEMWKAIKAVHSKGLKLDYVTLYEHLKSTGSELGPAEIFSYDGNVQIANLSHYAMRLAILAKRRKMWHLGQMLIQAGTQETEEIDVITSKLVSEFDAICGFYTGGMTTLRDTYEVLNERIRQNLSHETPITGTPTGFKKLDEKGGLHRSSLVIVAAETSQGKTSFATELAKNAIKSGKKVAFYTMEMENDELCARILSTECGVPANEILFSGELSDYQLKLIDNAKQSIPAENLFFDDDSGTNIDKIITSIETMKRKYDIDGAVVDYLQVLNVNQKNPNKEQAMGDASRRLKNIAKDLKIWVIALSQLNRDSMNPQPNINRLRDSGQIAEAADVVALIYRPEYYHRQFPEPFANVPTDGKALITIAKGRNIGTFQFICNFDRRYTKFSDCEDYNQATESIPLPTDEQSNDAPF